ncbi:MAG: tripartite tricarboxylate transporter substrate binding protein [Burkholderiales bacterium]
MIGFVTRALRALFIVALAASGSVFAQAWPSKSITLIVPFPAGGTTDLISRPLAQKLSEVLHQPVVVENRGGAGGTVGAGAAARSAPDGYTFLIGAVHHTIATTLYKNLPYNFEKDFAPVTVVAYVPNIVVAHSSVAAKNMQELTSLAKAKPGSITYGSAGNGTSHHMAAELYKSMAKVDLQHVPYKGGGPMMNDLIGGQISVAFETAASATPQIKGGKIKALAITTAKRSATMPDLPTVAESGLPGYDVVTWYGMLAPAATPKDIVSRMNTEVLKILQTPEFKQRLTDISSEPGDTTPEKFADLIRSDTVKWAKVVKESGATID